MGETTAVSSTIIIVFQPNDNNYNHYSIINFLNKSITITLLL